MNDRPSPGPARAPRRALLALCLGLLAAGCSALGLGPKRVWVEEELPGPSDEVVWQVVVRSLERMSFPRGSGLDRTLLYAESGWRTHPGTHKGKGYRVKAHVQVEGAGGDRYLVRVRVERQKNVALVNPADLRYAEWEAEPDDEGQARILLQHVKTFLTPDLSGGGAPRG